MVGRLGRLEQLGHSLGAGATIRVTVSLQLKKGALAKLRSEYLLQGPSYSDNFWLATTPLKVMQPPRIAPPDGDQVCKHMSLWGHFTSKP